MDHTDQDPSCNDPRARKQRNVERGLVVGGPLGLQILVSYTQNRAIASCRQTAVTRPSMGLS
jgi:hypothetical protein